MNKINVLQKKVDTLQVSKNYHLNNGDVQILNGNNNEHPLIKIQNSNENSRLVNLDKLLNTIETKHLNPISAKTSNLEVSLKSAFKKIPTLNSADFFGEKMDNEAFSSEARSVESVRSTEATLSATERCDEDEIDEYQLQTQKNAENHIQISPTNSIDEKYDQIFSKENGKNEWKHFKIPKQNNNNSNNNNNKNNNNNNNNDNKDNNNSNNNTNNSDNNNIKKNIKTENEINDEKNNKKMDYYMKKVDVNLKSKKAKGKETVAESDKFTANSSFSNNCINNVPINIPRQISTDSSSSPVSICSNADLLSNSQSNTISDAAISNGQQQSKPPTSYYHPKKNQFRQYMMESSSNTANTPVLGQSSDNSRFAYLYTKIWPILIQTRDGRPVFEYRFETNIEKNRFRSNWLKKRF